jgi:redox-sensitive bicupin YhaK (pirin superfamily)
MPTVLPPEGDYSILPHPHIGLSTVSYFYAGQNVHRDSLGTVQVNRPGDLNVMTAGRGIVHSERADPAWRRQGGPVHAVQIWLGLPSAHEEDPPSFEHHPQATLPEVKPGAGVGGRVLLGSAFGERSPVRHPGQPLLVDLALEAGARLAVPAEAPERALFVVEGAVGIEGADWVAERLVVLRPGAEVPLEARGPSRALLLGGPPLDGPRHMDWNFVSSRVERLQQAVAQWKAGAFPRIPGDDVEFVPYPERKPR